MLIQDPSSRPNTKRRRSPSSSLVFQFSPLVFTDVQLTKRPRQQDPGSDSNEVLVTVSDNLSAACAILAEHQGGAAHPGFDAAVENIVNVLRVAEKKGEIEKDGEELRNLLQELNKSVVPLATGGHISEALLSNIDEFKQSLEEVNGHHHEACTSAQFYPLVDVNCIGVIIALKAALHRANLTQTVMGRVSEALSISHAPHTIDNTLTNDAISSTGSTSSQGLVSTLHSDLTTIIHEMRSLDLSTRVVTGDKVNCGGYSDILRGSVILDDKLIEVAIKVLRVQGYIEKTTIEERLRKRFHREVLLWRRLQHSNVVPLLGYIILPDGLPALISPWYVNGNVIRYLQLYPTSDRLSLSLDVVRGLEYLHSIQATHGDLKGENVLVDANGRASLCDFGMSQFIDEASRISGFTTTHAYVGGTDRFMCPELLEDQPKTPATDIWALGCLVAQILTDVIPYQDITRKQAVPVAILKGDPPMVNMDGAIAESLWNCIKECWSKTPNDRPDTSEIKRHVIAAMDPIVEGPNCSGDINEPALHSQSSDFGPSIKYLESIRTWKANPHIPVSEVKGCLERLVCSTVLTDESFSWKSDSRVSPDGEFFAVVNQAGSISISRTNGIQVEPIKTWTIGQLPPWLTRPLVTWSATQRHLLIYSWHSLLSEPAFQKVFSLETGTLLLDTDSEFAKFTHDGSAIVFLRHVNKSCIQLTYQELVAGIPLISSKLIPEGTDDACDMFTNTDNRYTTIITASQYIVYDWRDDEIERMTYMNPSYFRAICAVSISQDGRFFLRTLPAEKPTLWRISTPGSPNSRPDPSIVTSYIAPNSSGRIVYYLGVQFGGLGDQLVVAHIQQAQYNGADFCIWDRDTSALLHSLSMSDRFHYCRAQFIWNSIIPGDIKLVLQRSTRPEGRGPSMVQIWSCSSQH